MVAMITATIGRPSNGLSTTRSRAKPKPIMTASTITTAAIAPTIGETLKPTTTAPTSAAIITNSPWAKLIASVAL